MKTNQIFIGDIKKCTKYDVHTTFSSSMYIGEHCIGGSSIGYVDEEYEIYKENAVLIKVADYAYVDLESLNSILDYIRIYRDMLLRDYSSGLIISTSAYCINTLIVDENFLMPYYTDERQVEDISIRKLKQRFKNKDV